MWWVPGEWLKTSALIVEKEEGDVAGLLRECFTQRSSSVWAVLQYVKVVRLLEDYLKFLILSFLYSEQIEIDDVGDRQIKI